MGISQSTNTTDQCDVKDSNTEICVDPDTRGQCDVKDCNTDNICVDSDYNNVLSAVERGEESAKTKLAWYKLCGLEGAKKDVDEAVALLKERVKAGDGEAMWMLGICKEYGIGTERDIEGAEKLYSESNERGDATGEVLMTKKEYGRGSGKMTLSGLF